MNVEAEEVAAEDDDDDDDVDWEEGWWKIIWSVECNGLFWFAKASAN